MKKIVKKAQSGISKARRAQIEANVPKGNVATGVQISKKDMKAHPEDFEYLKEKKAAPKKKSGGSIQKAKSGGQLPLLHTKPATPNTGDAVAAASHSASKSFKPVRKNVGKRVARLKAGGNMGKCKGGC